MAVYIGVDFHARSQTVCWCDTADGEMQQRTLTFVWADPSRNGTDVGTEFLFGTRVWEEAAVVIFAYENSQVMGIDLVSGAAAFTRTLTANQFTYVGLGFQDFRRFKIQSTGRRKRGTQGLLILEQCKYCYCKGVTGRLASSPVLLPSCSTVADTGASVEATVTTPWKLAVLALGNSSSSVPASRPLPDNCAAAVPPGTSWPLAGCRRDWRSASRCRRACSGNW